jgi:hypothetical protein
MLGIEIGARNAIGTIDKHKNTVNISGSREEILEPSRYATLAIRPTSMPHKPPPILA